MKLFNSSIYLFQLFTFAIIISLNTTLKTSTQTTTATNSKTKTQTNFKTNSAAFFRMLKSVKNNEKAKSETGMMELISSYMSNNNNNNFLQDQSKAQISFLGGKAKPRHEEETIIENQKKMANINKNSNVTYNADGEAIAPPSK